MHARGTDRLFAWVIGSLTVIASIALASWFLAIPAVFSAYYPCLVSTGHARDATTVVRWLSSQQRERTLGVAVTDRQLGAKELRHFADVRRVLQRLPLAAATLALITGALALLAGREGRARVPRCGLLVWGGLLLLAGGLAVADWTTFFAWAHRPLFGERSWRLPNNAYSLELFPATFWRGMTVAVLLAPGVFLGAMLALQRITASSSSVDATSPSRDAPAERTPTTP